MVILLSALLLSCKSSNEMDAIVVKGLKRAQQQSLLMARDLSNEPDSMPRSMDKNGRLIKSDTHWWCSGFFPGVLWQLYNYNNNDEFRKYATEYTDRLTSQQYTTDNHDIGFILMCSFGNGYQLTHTPQYANVLLQGAKSLATRFNPRVGLIRSWDHSQKKWKYPVIIDNMMNLELLEWASHHSGSKQFDQIARSHAMKTMINHFRNDGSSYHVVSYDPETGKVEKRDTHQGYSANSAWARGQAWGIYGYTMMYRETNDSTFLHHAIRIARFILNHPHLPVDGVPYWDFDDPKIPNVPRDASAAAIMASAFIELSGLCLEKTLKDSCLSMAQKQIRTLTSNKYLAKKGTNAHFILKHSVGNLPNNVEVDAPLTYADYYYVEALIRLYKMKNIR